MSRVKIISFSLYGTNKKYFYGALRNAQLAQKIYPHWKVSFYCGRSIGVKEKIELKNFNVDIHEVDEEENYAASLWRFRAIFQPNAGHIIFRDCDSRLTQREFLATNDWVISDKTIHIMKDHPNHDSVIMAGMCGLFAPNLKLKQSDLYRYKIFNYYGVDQDFLRREIYKKNYSRLVHDFESFKYKDTHSFATRSENLEFIGEIYDEKENPDLESRKILQKYSSTKQKNRKILKNKVKTFLYDIKLSVRIFLKRNI